MTTCYRKSLTATAIAVLTAFCIAFCPSSAQAAAPPGAPPLPARRVLRDVGDLMGQKAYDAAIQKLTAFRQRGGQAPSDGQPDPEGYRHPLIDLALGNLYLLKQEPQKAKAPLSRVVAEMPERADAWVNLGKACYETRDYRQAARCFANAYQRSGETDKDPQHLYFSAVSHLLDKDFANAAAVFEHLFAAHPTQIRPEWRENFVHALMAAEKPRRALPVVRQLAQQSTRETRLKWQEMLLQLYMQLEMAPEARACARQLTVEHPADAKWWKALTHVELSAARYAEALAALTVCGYLEPLTEKERRLWADLNLQLDIPARAAPVYAELLETHPDRKLLENLISAHRQMGHYDEALALLDRHAAGTEDPNLLMLRADLLYSARRFAEAAEAYRMAARKDKRVAGQAWLMAGYAAWQVNDLETSRQAFRQAQGSSRHKQAALKAMRQLEALN